MMMKIGSVIQFGDYDWRVLDIQNDKALLLSDKILEGRTYHSSFTDITWENSDIRKYLNNEFLNRFSKEERSIIIQTHVINNGNQWHNTEGGNDTKDYIFLLSLEEVVKYFGDSGQLRDRLLSPSPHHKIDDQFNKNRIAYDMQGASYWWWLRSPGNIGTAAAFVSLDGLVFVLGGQVILGFGGVRPALWLNLDALWEFEELEEDLRDIEEYEKEKMNGTLEIVPWEDIQKSLGL